LNLLPQFVKRNVPHAAKPKSQKVGKGRDLVERADNAVRESRQIVEQIQKKADQVGRYLEQHWPSGRQIMEAWGKDDLGWDR
jgi:hypothetical protein